MSRCGQESGWDIRVGGATAQAQSLFTALAVARDMVVSSSG